MLEGGLRGDAVSAGRDAPAPRQPEWPTLQFSDRLQAGTDGGLHSLMEVYSVGAIGAGHGTEQGWRPGSFRRWRN